MTGGQYTPCARSRVPLGPRNGTHGLYGLGDDRGQPQEGAFACILECAAGAILPLYRASGAAIAACACRLA